MNLQKNKTLVWIFTIAFIVRIIFLIILSLHGGEETLVLGDTKRYLAIAQSVVSGEGYLYKGFLESYRAPGYPGYLMPFVAFNIPLWIASVLQIIIASLIPVFVYKFWQKYIGIKGRWIWLPVVLAIIEPVQVYYSVVLLPDVFFAALFLLGLHYVLKWFEGRTLKSLVFAAICFGFSNYMRPAGIYMMIFFGLCGIAYFLYKKQFTKKVLGHIVLFVVLSLLCILPWSLRNYVAYGSLSFVSSSAYNALVYAAASSKAVETGRDYNEVKLELLATLAKEAPVPRNPNNLQNEEYILGVVKETILTYPKGFIKTYLLGLNTFLFSGNYHYLLLKHGFIAMPEKGLSFSLILADKGLGGMLSKVGTYAGSPYVVIAILGKIFWLVVTVGSIIGAWRMRSKSGAFVFLMGVAYFAFTILSVTIGVEARHRYMLNPLIFVFFTAMLVSLRFKSPFKVKLKLSHFYDSRLQSPSHHSSAGRVKKDSR